MNNVDYDFTVKFRVNSMDAADEVDGLIEDAVAHIASKIPDCDVEVFGPFGLHYTR